MAETDMRGVFFGSVALAALGVGWWTFSARGIPTPSPKARLSADPAYQVVGGVDGGNRCRVLLTNPGNEAVHIQRLDVGCAACTKLSDDPTGRTIPAGGTIPVEIEFLPPETGVEPHQILIEHSGDDSPVRVSFDVCGRRRPPYVASATTFQVAYFDLKLPAQPRLHQLECWEIAGEPAWLQGLSSDIPEMAIQPIRTREEPLGSLVRRTYEYRLEWTRMPQTAEFHGSLQLRTRDGISTHALIQGTLANTP
ncbi:MAG TPA: hypothetical protein VH092_34330 [Urbifossiella sp.]|jgi:hypothetical protein|nr:hypothetical protein [Urbifossiella sp.]